MVAFVAGGISSILSSGKYHAFSKSSRQNCYHIFTKQQMLDWYSLLTLQDVGSTDSR